MGIRCENISETEYYHLNSTIIITNIFELSLGVMQGYEFYHEKTIASLNFS